AEESGTRTRQSSSHPNNKRTFIRRDMEHLAGAPAPLNYTRRAVEKFQRKRAPVKVACSSPASWLRAPVQPPAWPVAAARDRCLLCREPRLRPESRLPHNPCTLPERRSHAGKTDDAEALAAQAALAPCSAKPD